MFAATCPAEFYTVLAIFLASRFFQIIFFWKKSVFIYLLLTPFLDILFTLFMQYETEKDADLRHDIATSLFNIVDSVALSVQDGGSGKKEK
jgi:hypothetical protein